MVESELKGMTGIVNWSILPDNLPAPADDHLAAHLAEAVIPNIALLSTSGSPVDLAAASGRTVVYIYPRTAIPGEPVFEWNSIPGARGCTPQSCAFRDHYTELKTLGAEVFGLSVQSTAHQAEAAERLHLPFALLSDENRAFANALNLPRFEGAGDILLKRLTLIIRDGVIEHVFYPVFPPDKNAGEVVAWLKANPVSDPSR